MSKVNIMNVVVLNNPCSFTQPFQFEITFDCIEYLADDLEWKITYVGSAESESYDQVLEEVLVGPVKAGRHMFVFEADAPDHTKIPPADIVGVTVVLLTCSYRKQEFIRVGYYVSNEYTDPELKENPPAEVNVMQLHRNILATCPRVTRVNINWNDPEPEQQVETSELPSGAVDMPQSATPSEPKDFQKHKPYGDSIQRFCEPNSMNGDDTMSDGDDALLEQQRSAAPPAPALKENTSSNINGLTEPMES